MSSTKSSANEPQILMTGILFGEQPRWHEDRLWFSDWGAREVIAVNLEGNSEVMQGAPSFPCCVDWLPDGRLLSSRRTKALLLRREPDGTLVTHGDLSKVSNPRSALHRQGARQRSKACVPTRTAGSRRQLGDLHRCHAHSRR